MPIETVIPVRRIGQEEHAEIDHVITGFAFDIHNEFGKYLDESIYKRELARCCRRHGFTVTPEMQIVVSLDDFRKPYYVDHLINSAVVVESKTAVGLRADALCFG